MLAVVCPIEGAVPERYGQLIDTVLQNAKKVSGDKKDTEAAVILWKIETSGWKIGRSPTSACGYGPRSKTASCRSISGTRRWEIWSSWQSTAISMPNTSWDCCIGTAGCSSRTLRKSGIGWNRRQNRIFRTRNTPWATGLTTTKIRRWIVSAWAA